VEEEGEYPKPLPFPRIDRKREKANPCGWIGKRKERTSGTVPLRPHGEEREKRKKRYPALLPSFGEIHLLKKKERKRRKGNTRISPFVKGERKLLFPASGRKKGTNSYS